MYFTIKTLLSAVVIAAVSELSRRYTLFASLLIALPLTSLLAFCWIYYESKDTQKIIDMSYSVFWLVIPSLLFFLLLPALLKMNYTFAHAMLLSCAALAVLYLSGAALYRWFGQ
jgi:ABC-type dipeptide/oligopeptide/nickel transport system permease subunit